MIWILSLWAFLLLGGFLLLAVMKNGVPEMVSDIYYELEGRGWVFSAVMAASAVLMMVCLLDTGLGCQPLAFLGCAALVMVGMAPNYLSEEEHPAHKTAAIGAAMGCVGWCVTAQWEVTVFVVGCWLLYWAWSRGRKEARPWFWAEVAAFADVFLTYWSV